MGSGPGFRQKSIESSNYLTFNNIKIPMVKKVKLEIQAETIGGRTPPCPKDSVNENIIQ